MRIALTHPFCWPYVRRGAERFLDDYARYLTERGHEVTTISTKPGPSADERGASGRRILRRHLWAPWMGRLRVPASHAHFLSTLRWLQRVDVDVVHSLFYVDAAAARLARRRRGFKVVYSLTGVPPPGALPRWAPPDQWLLRRAVTGADATMVPSEFAAAALRQSFAADSVVIPVPVNLEVFRARLDGNGGPPRILSVASFDDERKGLQTLVSAFRRVKEDVRDAVLVLSGAMSPATRARVFREVPSEMARDVELAGLGTPESLPELYRGASLFVLPAMWEAFGMVVLESWACGTPVVVTDHGGLSELVRGTREGIVFDPGTEGSVTRNVAGLARAMRLGLELAEEPGVRARCRARAERFSWERFGPRFESLYG